MIVFYSDTVCRGNYTDGVDFASRFIQLIGTKERLTPTSKFKGRCERAKWETIISGFILSSEKCFEEATPNPYINPSTVTLRHQLQVTWRLWLCKMSTIVIINESAKLLTLLFSLTDSFRFWTACVFRIKFMVHEIDIFCLFLFKFTLVRFSCFSVLESETTPIKLQNCFCFFTTEGSV